MVWPSLNIDILAAPHNTSVLNLNPPGKNTRQGMVTDQSYIEILMHRGLVLATLHFTDINANSKQVQTKWSLSVLSYER